MAIKISKLRFMQFGKEAPKSSKFKGTLTTESLIGYSNYMDRDDAKENVNSLDDREGGYIGYTSSHHKSYTMSSLGLIRSDDDRRKLIEELGKAYCKEGDVFYENVISLRTHKESARYGLNDVEGWNDLLVATLPPIFKKKGLDPNNMIWFADFHSNTEHPHIHLVFLEKNTTQSRAAFSPSELKYMKRKMYTHMTARKDLADRTRDDYRKTFEKKDIQFREIVMNVDGLLSRKRISMNTLRKSLPKHGRLQYDSMNMRDHRELLDRFIDQLIESSPETERCVKDWLDTIELLERNMNNSSGTEIASIREAEMKKLYRRVGNMILKNIRNGEPIEEKSSIRGNSATGKNYRRRLFTKPQARSMLMASVNEERRAIREALADYEQTKREQEEFLKMYQ